jgi:stage II sporulation protein D
MFSKRTSLYLVLYSLSTLSHANSYFPLQKHAFLYKKLALEHPVRILLDEKSSGEVQWKLACEDGISLYDPITGRTKHLEDKSLQLRYEGNTLYYNAQKIERSQLFFMPRGGILQCNGTSYPGIVSLDRTSESTYLVNHVGLESYLEGVLPYEGVPSWPDEVQKALCVACRSYAVARISQRRSLGREWPYPYDLKSGVDDQVYKGYESGVNLKRIIDATKGLIMTFERKPVLAMFSAVCGGVIPSEKKTEIYQDAPYLKRTYACTHCKDHRLFRWEQTLPFADLEEPLRAQFPELKSIVSISIDGFDLAGVAQTIVIVDTENHLFRMPAHDFRMLFYKNIKSICCEIIPDPLTLQLKGKGFGHHIGLCQWGAHAMDLQGYSWKSILTFFYPGTILNRIRKGKFLTS